MTAKQIIQAKPGPVRELIKMRMTRESLGDDAPDWDCYAAEALGWWNEMVAYLRDGALDPPEVLTEQALAELVLRQLRQKLDSVWNRIHGGLN